jgi:hypothetical protein
VDGNVWRIVPVPDLLAQLLLLLVLLGRQRLGCVPGARMGHVGQISLRGWGRDSPRERTLVLLLPLPLVLIGLGRPRPLVANLFLSRPYTHTHTHTPAPPPTHDFPLEYCGKETHRVGGGARTQYA